jgi:hypothetical protein
MLRQFAVLGKLKFVPRRQLAYLLAVAASLGLEDLARAASDDETPDTEAPPPSLLETHYPPTVDGPGLQLPYQPTQLYFDTSFGRSGDLSSLPYVAGNARNLRLTLGGVWRWRRFAFEAEIPFLNVTLLHVTQVVGGPPDNPDDVDQTVFSFGDVRLGGTWTLPVIGEDTLVAGVGFRSRLASHTAQYHFDVDGVTTTYVFPYYFHLAPTVILGGALGRFTFVMNQGPLFFVGPDGYYIDLKIVEPTMMFWDSHYAVSYSPVQAFGASLELVTTIQLNHVTGMNFGKFNDIRAVWLAPAVQFHFDAYRVDVIGRIGTSRGENLLGVLEYVGERSILVRLTRTFN